MKQNISLWSTNVTFNIYIEDIEDDNNWCGRKQKHFRCCKGVYFYPLRTHVHDIIFSIFVLIIHDLYLIFAISVLSVLRVIIPNFLVVYKINSIASFYKVSSGVRRFFETHFLSFKSTIVTCTVYEKILCANLKLTSRCLQLVDLIHAWNVNVSTE